MSSLSTFITEKTTMLLSTTVKQTLMRPLQGVLCRTLAGEPEILMKTECPGPKSKAIMEDLDSLQSMKRWVSSTPFAFQFRIPVLY